VSVLFDYFRAANEVQVRKHMDDNDALSPVPATFDGMGVKTIDPCVILGQLVAFVTGQDWSPDMVGDRLIWPEGGGQDMTYEGPWVSVLDDRARDVLASIPADRTPDLAERWATVEEFGGYAEQEYLRDVVADFAALAVHAREHGESLYCWMSL